MRVFGSILLGVSLIGCVAPEGDESFAIIHHQAPPAGDQCVITSDRTMPFLSRGVVFLTGGSYVAIPLMESRIIAAEGRESLRTIFVHGANVTLEVSEATVVQGGQLTTLGSPQTHEYQILFSAAISPNGGLTAAFYDLIPFSIMAEITSALGGIDPFAVDTSIALEAVATSTVFADYYGDRIEATPYQFPVTITNNNIASLGTCPLPAATVLPEPANACSNFQDTVVLCCEDEASGTFLCPPTLAVCGDGICTPPDETNATCAVDCP